jgi:hypothetical protein
MRRSESGKGWWAYRQERRAIKREVRAERRGGGTKTGDVIGDASMSARGSGWNAGFYRSKSRRR